MHLDNVKVKITDVQGEEPRYDAWSVTAKLWVQDRDEKKYVRDVAVNVLKDEGLFDEPDEGNPRIIERLKEVYENNLLEDEEFKAASIQSLEDEKSKAKSMQGKEYEF